MTTSVTAGVGGGGLAAWLGFQKSRKKRQTTSRSIIKIRRFFVEILDKKRRFSIYEIHISDKNGPNKPTRIASASSITAPEFLISSCESRI